MKDELWTYMGRTVNEGKAIDLWKDARGSDRYSDPHGKQIKMNDERLLSSSIGDVYLLSVFRTTHNAIPFEVKKLVKTENAFKDMDATLDLVADFYKKQKGAMRVAFVSYVMKKITNSFVQ